MKELLEIIAKNLVDNKDCVSVTEKEKEDGSILYELRVAEDEVGKVIGKNGRIAKSIRAVVKAAAINENKKVYVEII